MTALTRRKTLGLPGRAALPLPFIRPARTEEAALNVYNWADCIGETGLRILLPRPGSKWSTIPIGRGIRGQAADRKVQL